MDNVLLGAMLALPYLYLTARIISFAYFQTKLWYHRTALSQLKDGGCNG